MVASAREALAVLGLQPGASQEDIRTAYKSLALKWHPDKQQQQQQQQQQLLLQQSPGASGQHEAAATTAFAQLSAAYQLLSAAVPAVTSCVANSSTGNSTQTTWPSYEAAYATGSLFSEQLVDEAVRAAVSPADVAVLEQLAAAAAGGELPAALSAVAPSQQDEQLWQQLYESLLLRQQLLQRQAQQQQQSQRQRQQQQQVQQQDAAGVCIGELLSDLLIKPTGPVLLEVSDDEEEGEGQQQQQQQCQGAAKKRLRRGLGFYWMWLRRLLLAKAVVSLLTSRQQRRGSGNHCYHAEFQHLDDFP